MKPTEPSLFLALSQPAEISLQLLEQVHPHIDGVEIATLLMLREGLSIIPRIQQITPGLPILADIKVFDAGRAEAELAYNAGCDLITMLAVADDSAIRGTLETAGEAGKTVLADMSAVPDLLDRSHRLLDMGCTCLYAHTAHTLQDRILSPHAQLKLLRDTFPETALAVGGGINLENVSELLPLFPQVIVVGGAISRAQDPLQAAQTFHDILHGQPHGSSL